MLQHKERKTKVSMNKQKEFAKMRIRILDAANWKCAYCDGKAEYVDHVKPKHLGEWTNSEWNLVPCCPECNSRARSRVFESFEEKKKYIIKGKFYNCFRCSQRLKHYYLSPMWCSLGCRKKPAFKEVMLYTGL